MEFHELLVENEEIYSPSDQVFVNPLLLEKILDYSIHKTDIYGSNRVHRAVSTAGNFRLVSKIWLDTVSRIIKRRRYKFKSLTFNLHGINDPTKIANEMAKGKKLLHRAVSIFSSPDHLAQISMLPFALVVCKTFLNEEFYAILDLLKKCGPSLLILGVQFSKTISMSILDFVTQPFPNLLNFALLWSDQEPEDLTQDESTLQNGEALERLEAFAQAVLDGTERLERLVFDCEVCLSKRFPNIRLPTTLLEVTLGTPELDMLTHSQLPNLRNLVLQPEVVEGGPTVHEGLLTQILEKYRKTLVYFYLESDGFNPSVKLPVMEELKSFKIKSSDCTWESSNSEIDFAKYLPVVTDLTLDIEEDTSFLQWLDNDHSLETLKSLEIIKSWNWNNIEMQMINKTFPNLHSLNVRVNKLGMRVLFQEMRQLQKLTLVFGEELSSCYWMWVRQLVGITKEELNRIKTAKKSRKVNWRGFKVNRKKNAVSILNLPEMTHLNIDYISQNQKRILFPDLVFCLAWG